MNRRRRKAGSDYRQLQTKLFLQTIGILVAAAAIIWGLYQYVLKGHIADFIVSLLNRFIYHDYSAALFGYQLLFRNNMVFFFVAAITILFLIILRIYFNSFSRYFHEINKGIDALLEENSGDVSLPSELAATENKINSIKHMLEQRKLAAELAEQRKNELVIYLAHDLKTPLTSVIGYLTLLRDELQISEGLREKYLSIALDKAERLEELINEFFESTRFGFSDVVLEYGRMNLTRLLEQLTYEFRPMLAEKQLECELVAEQDIMMKCDVDKLQRVFDNLLRNAVNYSFENSRIQILVVQEEHQVRIKFKNHGNTIPKEKLERIFEQFYRLDTARSSKTGGAGLGLAIAKEIVELHHGTIIAKSEEETIEFEVTLPLL